jgi:hypothetical protein
MTQVSPLQTIVNQSAVKAAEAQYRLALLFTPYGFTPERQDFDRMDAFLDDPYRAFPQPTEAVKTSLERTVGNLQESRAILQAFAAQGTEPTLDAEQLFATARANVVGNRMNTAAYQASA